MPAACSWCATKQFDVIVTDNLLDMLSDIAAMLPARSACWLRPRSARRVRRKAQGAVRAGARLRPGHRRRGVANPIAMTPVHGAALLLDRGKEADLIDQTSRSTRGCTADIKSAGSAADEHVADGRAVIRRRWAAGA
jgi:isocitrate/isopropylmalate dehydrogenase